MVSFAKPDSYYRGIHQKVFDMVPLGAKRVLDVGCGTGELGRKLKAEKKVEQVVGVEIVPEVALEAKEKLDKIIRTDVESVRLDSFTKYFDCIIMSGILHHLRDPWTVLKRFRNYLKDDGCLISSVPNVAHISVIKDLLAGKWEYKNEGILDVSHMKFFTFEGLTEMFHTCGYKGVEVEEDIDGLTPDNVDLVKVLGVAAKVGPNFQRDSFVLQFITKWVKA